MHQHLRSRYLPDNYTSILSTLSSIPDNHTVCSIISPHIHYTRIILHRSKASEIERKALYESVVLPPVIVHALAPEALLHPRYVHGREVVDVGVAGAGSTFGVDNLRGGRRRRWSRHRPRCCGGGFRLVACLDRRGGGRHRRPWVEGHCLLVLDPSRTLVQTNVHCTREEGTLGCVWWCSLEVSRSLLFIVVCTLQMVHRLSVPRACTIEMYKSHTDRGFWVTEVSRRTVVI